jgi:hypothetical protein
VRLLKIKPFLTRVIRFIYGRDKFVFPVRSSLKSLIEGDIVTYSSAMKLARKVAADLITFPFLEAVETNVKPSSHQPSYLC